VSRNMVISGVPKSSYKRPTCIRSMGSPKGRESYGDGALIVVCDGESPLHTSGTAAIAGEVEQVSQISDI
jgi:hypothetical protein